MKSDPESIRQSGATTRKEAQVAQVEERLALAKASHEQRLDAAVETLVQEWSEVVPDLDLDVRAIAARIARIDDRLRDCTADILKQSGLSDNEFRLLAGLMRIGAPHRCAPTELAGRYVPVTSGGLTGLARRLEGRGLIRRVSHPSDQRSVLIELTDEGKYLIFKAMRDFSNMEKSLMKGISSKDLKSGSRFLSKLLNSIQSSIK